jgi:hypothetical protein
VSAVTTFARRRATLVLEPAPVPPCRVDTLERAAARGSAPRTEAQVARRFGPPPALLLVAGRYF